MTKFCKWVLLFSLLLYSSVSSEDLGHEETVEKSKGSILFSPSVCPLSWSHHCTKNCICFLDLTIKSGICFNWESGYKWILWNNPSGFMFQILDVYFDFQLGLEFHTLPF